MSTPNKPNNQEKTLEIAVLFSLFRLVVVLIGILCDFVSYCCVYSVAHASQLRILTQAFKKIAPMEGAEGEASKKKSLLH